MKLNLNKYFIFQSPVFLLVLIGIIYFTIGTINITTHRGEMDWILSLKVMIYGSIGLFLGGCCYNVRTLPRVKVVSDHGIGFYLSFFLWVIGFLISIYMINSVGLLMFSSSSHLRYATSAKLLYFQEILLVLPSLYIFTFNLNSSKNLFLVKILIPITILLLLSSGYRGVSIIFIISLFIIFYLHPNRKIKISAKKIILALFSIYLILAGGFLLRRSLGSELIPIDEVVESLNYPNNFFAKSMLPIYLTFREGVGVFQNLYFKGSGNEHIFFSDLLTILPGKQKSGGSKVAQIVYGVKDYKYGLTPTLYGALYYDGGLAFLLIITFILGYILNRLFNLTKTRYSTPTIILFSLFFSSSLHLMHRGVYKPMYLFYIFGLFFLIIFAEVIYLISRRKFF